MMHIARSNVATANSDGSTTSWRSTNGMSSPRNPMTCAWKFSLASGKTLPTKSTTWTAIDAYRQVTDIDNNHVPALEQLAKLYEKQGDTAQSLECMQRVADLTLDSTQRVDMLYRIGKAHDEKLGDRISAQEKFRAALDIDPKHLPSLAALRLYRLDTAEWYEAAQLLDQEQQNTTVPRQKAKLLVELGKLRDEMLGEHESAILAYEGAIVADPENEDAAIPLSEEYVNSGSLSRPNLCSNCLRERLRKRTKRSNIGSMG